jgi:hypothetical protein
MVIVKVCDKNAVNVMNGPVCFEEVVEKMMARVDYASIAVKNGEVASA